LVTTLTKRMAEELNKFLARYGVRCRYIHSDVDTLERVEIMQDLREGLFDVLIGVNLLREGLDFPEVSLVAILDADKEGFLRSERSLVQTIGRAARNINGMAIMYADKVTDSMQRTIDETNRRRMLQRAYNEKHGLKPQALSKGKERILIEGRPRRNNPYAPTKNTEMAAAEPKAKFTTPEQLEKQIDKTRREMEKAAKSLDFMEAARLRDVLITLEQARS